MDVSLSIVLNGDARSGLFMRWLVTKHIEHKFVIDLNEGDSHGDLIVETAANLREDGIDRTWDDAAIFVVGRVTSHREGLACTRLTIAHDGAVIAINNGVDSLLGAEFKYVLL